MARRKLRSPFRSASKYELHRLRALAQAVERWKASAISGDYHLLPFAHQILGNDGGIAQNQILDSFERRAWKSLSCRPDYGAIWSQHELEHMRRWDPKRYELRMLRNELAEYRSECRHRPESMRPPVPKQVAADSVQGHNLAAEDLPEFGVTAGQCWRCRRSPTSGP